MAGGRVPALSEGAAMALPWDPGLGRSRALLWDESFYFLALQSLPSPSGLLPGQAERSVVASERPSPPEALLPPTQLIGTPGTELPGGREAGRQAGFLSALPAQSLELPLQSCCALPSLPAPLHPGSPSSRGYPQVQQQFDKSPGAAIAEMGKPRWEEGYQGDSKDLSSGSLH